MSQGNEKAPFERTDLGDRAATPISVCMRSNPQQMAAANRDDMPGTVAYPASR